MLIDIKGSISPLFMMHKTFKDAIDPIISVQKRLTTSGQSIGIGTEHGPDVFYALVRRARDTIKGVISNYEDAHQRVPADCESANELLGQDDLMAAKKTFPTITVFQPYSTIALADLLLAHGAPDEAASVLAEWLWRWEQLDNLRKGLNKPPSLPAGEREAFAMPEWYSIEVLAKLQAILSDLAGQNNRSFKDILDHYRTTFADYVGSSERAISLDKLAGLCVRWDAGFANAEVARQVAFVLVGTEIDSLRTNLNFMEEAETVEVLENLRQRASTVAAIPPDCLPRKEPYNDDFRRAVVAEGRVIAGLTEIAIGDQMAIIAGSPEERNLAENSRKVGEDLLITGWAALRPIWRTETENDRKKEWADRLFRASQWDKTANLAVRVLSRLRRGD